MFGGVGRLARIVCYDTFINIRGDSHIPLIRIGNALDEIDVFQLWPAGRSLGEVMALLRSWLRRADFALYFKLEAD